MFVVIVVGTLIFHWRVFSLAYASTVEETCTITQFSQVANVVKDCTNIVVKGFDVPAGQTLHFNLKKGSSLTFEGIITFGFTNWYGPLIIIEGEDLKVQGETGSKFDGQGAKYWDGKGGGGVAKPSFIRVKGSGEFNKINLLNCPRQCASIHGSHISLDNWTIDVSAGDKDKINFAHNTDGFDVSGENIKITNSVVKNQDDCIVVNRGSNLFFKNIYCSGGHGLSIAVGMDAKVYENNVARNVTYEDCSVVNSLNGIHVKTVKAGGPGVIENINYNRIAMRGITAYGIRVHQDYPEDDKNPVGNVPIKDLRISHVRVELTGSSTPVNTLCATGACSDWQWSDITITGNYSQCSMNYKPSGFYC